MKLDFEPFVSIGRLEFGMSTDMANQGADTLAIELANRWINAHSDVSSIRLLFDRRRRLSGVVLPFEVFDHANLLQKYRHFEDCDGLVAYPSLGAICLDEGNGRFDIGLHSFPYAYCEVQALRFAIDVVRREAWTERQRDLAGWALEYLNVGEPELAASFLCAACSLAASRIPTGLLRSVVKRTSACLDDGTADIHMAQIDLQESIAAKCSGEEENQEIAELERVTAGISRTYGGDAVTRNARAPWLSPDEGNQPLPILEPKKFREVFGSVSFGIGLLKAIENEDLVHWTSRLTLRFGSDCGLNDPFAYDWKGRVYSVREGCVVVADPVSGDILETGDSFIDFIGPNPRIARLLAGDTGSYRRFVLSRGEVYRDEMALGKREIVPLSNIWGL